MKKTERFFLSGTSVAICLCMNMQTLLKRFQKNILSILFTVLSIFCVSSAQGVLFVTNFIKVEDLYHHELLEVSEGDPLSHLIDQIVLKILSTKTGSSFCHAVTAEQMKREFFVNKEYSLKALDLCKDYFKSESLDRFDFYKDYFIVIGKTKNLERLDGWTDFQNHTYLFFSSKSDITEERLTRTIAHEMAIAYDAKDMIGFRGMVELTKGVPIVRDETSCLLTQALSRSDLRHALKSIRAFEIEKRIAEELNISLPKGFAQWQNSSCASKLKFMFSQMQSLQDVLRVNEDRTYGYYENPMCSAEPMRTISQDDLIKNFEKLNLSFRDGSTMNACEYFTQGWPYISGRSFNGGPGPRIGGGAWQEFE